MTSDEAKKRSQEQEKHRNEKLRRIKHLNAKLDAKAKGKNK